MDGRLTTALHDMMQYRRTASARRCDTPAHRPQAMSAALNSAKIVSSRLGHAACTSDMFCYRIHVGDLIVDLRYFARHMSRDIRIAAGRALLLLPLNEHMEVVTETMHRNCPAGLPFLFSRDEAVTTIWHSSTWGLAIQFRRDRINAAASAAMSDARRLMSVALTLEPVADDRAIEQMAEQLITMIVDDSPQQTPTEIAVESRFYRALVDRIAGQQQSAALLSPVRSVSEAMRLVRENHCKTYTTEALAAAVGVTAQTLRKGFRSCLGISVKDYIQTVRLDWAHNRLASGRDSRPIEQIAALAGFPGSPPFCRAYMRRFGEPPSQTRAKAVRAATK